MTLLAPPMKNIKMYSRTFSGQPAVQVESEFKALLNLVKTQDVKSYLEVGVARGDSFHEIVTQMPKDSLAVAVDYPEQEWGLIESRNALIKAATDLIKNDYDISLIFGDSKEQETVNDVLKASESFDLVFIDGDHSYEGVKADWDNYGRLGRMVAFHDIVDSQLPNAKGEVVEVPRFWNEIKKQYRHIEFVEKGSTMGIGVIFKD